MLTHSVLYYFFLHCCMIDSKSMQPFIGETGLVVKKQLISILYFGMNIYPRKQPDSSNGRYYLNIM